MSGVLAKPIRLETFRRALDEHSLGKQSQRVEELLASAHKDLLHAEDVPEARGLRDRATAHVDEARQIVANADRTAHWQ